MKKLVFVSMILSACSVDRITVPNNPPKIPSSGAQKVSVETGVLKPKTFSVLMYPEHWENEAIAQKETARLLTEAAKLDRLLLETFSKNSFIAEMALKSQAMACLSRFAKSTTTNAVLGEIATEWNEVPADLGEQAAYTACSQNQLQREEALQRIKELTETEIPNQGAVINTIFDPEWKIEKPYVSKNVLTLKGTSSELVFKAGPTGTTVDITIKGFNFEKVDQSTVLVKCRGTDPKVGKKRDAPEGQIRSVLYNAADRTLDFEVPEMGVNETGELVATGGLFHFSLVRAQDFGPLARWVGEVKFSKGGKIQKGSVKIDGVMEPLTE